MDFNFSDKVRDLQKKVDVFMDAHVYPNENRFFEEIEENRRKGNAWIPTRIIEDLKPKARAAGLWNLWQAARITAARLPTWNTRRCARSWAGWLGARGVQLLGARYRQHGSAAALRHAGTAEAVARAATGRTRFAPPS